MAKNKQVNITVGADTKKAKSALNDVKSSLLSLKSYALTAAGAFGVGLGFSAIVGQARKMVDSLDAIGKSSSNLGVSAEYFQKLDFAASRTNTEIQGVFTAVARLKKLSGEFMAGESEATDIFSRLGIKREEIKDLAPEQLFDRVNAAISSITDNHARARVQADLYGKSAEKLNNFLREYKGLGQELADKGAIISDADVKAAEALKDSLENISRSLTKIVVDSGFIQWMANFTKEVEKSLDIQRRMKAVQSSAGFVSSPNESSGKSMGRMLLNGISLGANYGDQWLGTRADTETVRYDPSLDPEYKTVLERNKKLRELSGMNLKQRMDSEATDAAKKSQPVNQDWETTKKELEALKLSEKQIADYRVEWEKKYAGSKTSVVSFVESMLSMSSEVQYQALVAQGKRREAEWMKQEAEYRKQGRKQEEIDQLRVQWEKKFSSSIASEMADKSRSSLSEIRYNELMAMGKRREAEWSKEEEALKNRGLSADAIAKRRKEFDAEYDSKLKANMSDQTRSTETEIEYQKMLRTGSKKEAEWYKKQHEMRLEGYGQQEIDAYKSKWEELFRLQQPDIEAKYRATAAVQGSLEEYQLRTGSLGNVNQRQLDALLALQKNSGETNKILGEIKDKSGEGMTEAGLSEGTEP